MFISTGQLPADAQVQALVDEAYARFRLRDEGENAQHYPALARVPRDLFGICVVGVNGKIYAVGDAEVEFTIMSVAKPFVLALVCQALGPEVVREKIGVNATGLPFNSIMAVELHAQRLTNPMVNTGALATTSLIPGATAELKWQHIQEGLSAFAGRSLTVNEEVYASASASNHRNRGLAAFLWGYDRLYFDAPATLDLYTRQSSLNVTTKDLAIMGATLADGGVNPVTGVRVMDAGVCRYVLAVMATSGMYETSGEWLYATGLPGKSGVGGGILTIAPGKGGLGTFAPPLDAAGNSVKGQLVAHFLSAQLGLNLFASQPL
ncbi:glutaminase A [Candidatus Chloroploca sp. M-50]|uniref:Glutaminase n=1 Tax=Candidatus Chloroploca mongolica TaxID=2528176 RepID=A0ABS4DEN3_9CHLR|nr:glutaminase A [Candidatus Chloroploca mongolica]MBP1467893.1 glutaminase A [Candidatus Chloroploca mongolica]